MIGSKNQAQKLVDDIMFCTSLQHLDEVKAVAKLFIKEIKLNCVDAALPFWNETEKQLDRL
jgi:hypothetical protein